MQSVMITRASTPFKALSVNCQTVDRSVIYGVGSQRLTVCQNAELANDCCLHFHLFNICTCNQHLMTKVLIGLQIKRPDRQLAVWLRQRVTVISFDL